MKYVLRILGIIAAIVGIVMSVNLLKEGDKLELPEKRVRISSSYSAYDYPWEENRGAEYLGGDAYNYIVEASLKAGYYDAVATEKAVTRAGGYTFLAISVLLLFVSLYSLQRCVDTGKQLVELKRIEYNTERISKVPSLPPSTEKNDTEETGSQTNENS